MYKRQAQNTFEELLALGAVPIVNSNDSISTFEILHGDNDTLSAVVVSLVGADLLILLSDINGLYTDNPSTNPDAKFVPFVDTVDDELMGMGKGSVSGVGTGEMCIRDRSMEGQEEALVEIDKDLICHAMNGKPIKPKTLGQKKYVDMIRKNMIVFGTGPAGTGKTYLAMAMAITAFKNNEVSRIILTRPAIEAGEKLGFLPGDLQSKVDPYLRPLYDALYQIMGCLLYTSEFMMRDVMNELDNGIRYCSDSVSYTHLWPRS